MGDNNAGDTGHGIGGRSMWEEVYGPIAKEQADGAEPVIPLQHVVPEQAAAAADVPPPGTAVRSADDANPGASPPKKTRTGSSNQAL